MSISIHELLAVARESEGVKAVQGDAMLCENGLHRIPGIWWNFGVGADGAVWRRGNISSLLFNKESILRMVELQNQGILRFQRQALVLEGTLHYLPVQTFFQD